MKGLILKDLYMTKKYCGSYLAVIAIFVIISLLQDVNYFFLLFPCMLCGSIPLTIFSYDEKCGWSDYCGVLPLEKAQIVSGKYILSVIFNSAMLIIIGIADAAKLFHSGQFNITDYSAIMSLSFAAAYFTTSLSLPFIFKWGFDKGRIAYYFVIGLMCSMSMFLNTGSSVNISISQTGISLVIFTAAIMFFALSWRISIVIYQRREA